MASQLLMLVAICSLLLVFSHPVDSQSSKGRSLSEQVDESRIEFNNTVVTKVRDSLHVSGWEDYQKSSIRLKREAPCNPGNSNCPDGHYCNHLTNQCDPCSCCTKRNPVTKEIKEFATKSECARNSPAGSTALCTLDFSWECVSDSGEGTDVASTLVSQENDNSYTQTAFNTTTAGSTVPAKKANAIRLRVRVEFMVFVICGGLFVT
ncbi:uncharacterized protein LOC106161931 [Lingula anatina]|uniref:Uncharacterized protein LOC106161931 n=1 Tax=Lingula anatina TaxID=7574 RepID=A0A1S3IAN1_LINAN|nr:uncharacterized protein LOC106161931 [Lingula anatina]|eukprot:XP_013394464.1 uncharacterized protein LOC106161931 [Lingula anatina]